jgi:hypothetical protein
MPATLAAEPVPLLEDADKVLRVSGTRVPLETVIEAFQAGATPEEIAQDFPVLPLADVYAVITYYLRHRDVVTGYLERRAAQAAGVRARGVARFDQTGLRARLLARLEP